MTSARTPFVAGNWKMNTDCQTARQLAKAVALGLQNGTEPKGARVALCPPFPYLTTVAEVLADFPATPLTLGAQNCHFQPKGAFTGEISPAMLVDLGCKQVILGHSERRNELGESDEFINRKVHAAVQVGLEVILCIGEKLAERNANQTHVVLERQLMGSLADVRDLSRITLAYEPVWAIGTGVNATPEQAEEAHVFVRGWIRANYGEQAATSLSILYGGSVKGSNAAGLFVSPEVDGGLIGGASLDATDFLAIVAAAAKK